MENVEREKGQKRKNCVMRMKHNVVVEVDSSCADTSVKCDLKRAIKCQTKIKNFFFVKLVKEKLRVRCKGMHLPCQNHMRVVQSHNVVVILFFPSSFLLRMNK